MTTPEVDVVILTWNDGPMLDLAVSSALASEGVAVRVFVVDNGSSPVAEVADDPAVVLLRNETNHGVAGGRNQGIRLGRAPFVVLLDSDAVLHPDTISALLAPLNSSPAIALSVPRYTDQPLEAGAGRAPTLTRKVARALNLADTYGVVTRRDGDRWWEVDFGIGACQLFRRVAYESVGGIDESFFYGPEDVDFCLRLKNRGWLVVQAGEAVCDHPPRRRFRRVLTRRGLEHGWAVARFLWRHRRFSSG